MLNARAGAEAVVAAEEWHSDGAGMTANSSPRHGGRNWTTGVVYCGEPSDPANLGPLPISTLPSMLQCRMQTRLMRIGTDIVNMEMVTTDDGGRIPAQYQDFTISRIVISSWDTRTMWTYAAKIRQLSHRIFHGIERVFVRKSDFGSRRVGRAWEEMTRKPSRDKPHKLCRSTKPQEDRVRPRTWKEKQRLRQHPSHLQRRTADYSCVWTTELSIKPRCRADILSHRSRRCSTGLKECLSPHLGQRRWRVQNRGTIPVTGDELSAEQRRWMRGMTLPEMPEWRIRVHPMTQKSSGNECTRRAGISVPRNESTYAPSIQKMIRPHGEITTKAHSKRQWERTKRSPKRRTACRNMKQVNNQRESEKGQSKWKNETKQAKRQAKSKTSEIQRPRLPKDVSVNKHHQKSTEKSTSQVLPRSQKLTGISLLRSQPAKSNRSIMILLKPPFGSATLKLTGWSPQWTSNNESIPSTDDYWRQQILYRACGSTARTLKRAQAHLNLVSITILREAHLLDVDQCDATTHDAIDVHDWRLQPMQAAKLPSMPSHKRKLYHPANFNKDLRHVTSYGSDGQWNMG